MPPFDDTKPNPTTEAIWCYRQYSHTVRSNRMRGVCPIERKCPRRLRIREGFRPQCSRRVSNPRQLCTTFYAHPHDQGKCLTSACTGRYRIPYTNSEGSSALDDEPTTAIRQMIHIRPAVEERPVKPIRLLRTLGKRRAWAAFTIVRVGKTR